LVAAVALCIQHSQTITLISDFTIHVSAKKLNTKQKPICFPTRRFGPQVRGLKYFFFADEALKKLGGPAHPFLRLRGWLATTVVHNQWRWYSTHERQTLADNSHVHSTDVCEKEPHARCIFFDSYPSSRRIQACSTCF